MSPHSEKSGQRPALELATLGHPFTRVPDKHVEKPAETIDLHERLGVHEAALMEEYTYKPKGTFREEVDLLARMPSISFRHLEHLSKDELAKLWYSSPIEASFHQMFNGPGSEPRKSLPPVETWDPALRVLGKIKSSMWRWGWSQRDWNSALDCFEAMQRFDFAHPDFTVTLDYTTGCNERGYSEFARTYLDGVFGYLVSYKGEHVLTIGWSYSGHGEILLAQVQMKHPKGNRWCYKIGKPLLEHTLDRMHAAFGKRFPILIVDGESLAARIDKSYEDAREQARRKAEHENAPAPFVGPTPETMVRIARSYDRQIDGYRRSKETKRIGDVQFYRVRRVPVQGRRGDPEVSVPARRRGFASLHTSSPMLEPPPPDTEVLAARPQETPVKRKRI